MIKKKEKSSVFLKFNGENMSPSSLTISEITKILGILEQITTDSAEAEDKKFTLRLQALKSGSCGVALNGDIEEDFLTKFFRRVAQSFKENNLDGFTIDVKKKLEELNKFLKSKTSWIDVFRNEEDTKPLDTIASVEKLNLTGLKYIEGVTTVYGKVLWLGGKTPSVTIEIDEEKSFSCIISEKLVPFFADNIFKEVILHGVASWEPRTHIIKEFKIERVESRKLKPINEAMKNIKNDFGHYFDNIDNPDKWVREIRS
ncbi:MAG: hypothetical protein IPL26_13485 [Leptospiraceae bacterium]|nr:hypothetical protein [Leptospiraceae bacterium]